MGDPVSERAHYLAVGGEGKGDLFLIQDGRVEHMGLVRTSWWRTRRELREAQPPAGGLPVSAAFRRVLARVLALAVLFTV